MALSSAFLGGIARNSDHAHLLVVFRSGTVWTSFVLYGCLIDFLALAASV